MNLVLFIRSRQTPNFAKSKRVIEGIIENFVTMVAVTKQKAVPSIEFSTAKGNLERAKEVEDTMLDPLEPFSEGPEEYDASSSTPTAGGAAKHEVVEEKSLGDKISLVVTGAGRETLAKDTKS